MDGPSRRSEAIAPAPAAVFTPVVAVEGVVTEGLAPVAAIVEGEVAADVTPAPPADASPTWVTSEERLVGPDVDPPMAAITSELMPPARRDESEALARAGETSWGSQKVHGLYSSHRPGTGCRGGRTTRFLHTRPPTRLTISGPASEEPMPNGELASHRLASAGAVPL